MKNKIDIKKNIEKLLYSDSAPAVATKFLLMTIAMGGVVLGGAVVPGVLKLFKEFEADNDYPNKKINATFHALKRRKFIKIIKNKNGTIKVRLTNKGKKRVRDIYIDSLKIDKTKKWDKKWRILIFDIPIKLNNARAAFRLKIKELGFYQFQGSVWFYPYPCEDEVLAVAEFFKVSEYIEIITAESVLHEEELKKYFKIKQSK